MAKSETEPQSEVSQERPRRVPKAIAVVHADSCTGCEACMAVCPTDCITLLTIGLRVKGVDTWCEVDWEHCIGCALCVRIPRKKSDLYELKVCPWDAIEMIPTERLPEVVESIGAPALDAGARRERLLETARQLAMARAKQ